MSKRITAQQAFANYVKTSKDYFEQKEANRMWHISKLIKILVTSKNHTVKSAAPIAKRAYRMGVRIK